MASTKKASATGRNAPAATGKTTAAGKGKTAPAPAAGKKRK